jgi:predicted GIY-YIG superfamily endonuclease
MCDWVCYLITALEGNATYIGSTNNFERRLNNHNNNNPKIKRIGAKYTRGKTWMPILIISGFENKNSCLSFESGWKRLSKRRHNKRLYYINEMSNNNFCYGNDVKWNRIMDLLYFVHHFTYLNSKFKINYDFKHLINQPEQLTIYIFMETWIKDLVWPYFVTFS